MNYLKTIFILKITLLYINHDRICKDHENKKYLNFNFEEFKTIFNDDDYEKRGVYRVNSIYSDKIIENRFEKFKIENGRAPIFLYNKELINRRLESLNNKFNGEDFKKKLKKMKKLIKKAIKFFENMLIIYTDPIENLEFEINKKNFQMSTFDNLFKGDEKIFIKKFDYYLFFDFEYNKYEDYTAYCLSTFSKIIYHSRTTIGYVKINSYYLSEGKVKYEELMTVVHEILHSFGLTKKKIIKKTMNKILKMNDENKIKKYIKKNNDFYKLYEFWYRKNNLDKLYNKKSHFNPDYLMNEIMQPVRVYIKHLTYFSAGLFEILTNYEMRFNRKLLRRNYETCLPLIKEIFKDNCENSNGNFINSFKFNDSIRLNNKCSKTPDQKIANSFCNSSFQYKKYCNFSSNKIKNKLCYEPKNKNNSNCFDFANNFIISHDSKYLKEYFGKSSNCFEINVSNYIKPFCLKNDIDFDNSLINITIKVSRKKTMNLVCKYKKYYDNILKENIYLKIDHILNIKIKNRDLTFYCPDMNRFYKNNISNLCPNDCFLNGRCIDINKCECYRGFNPKNNCKNYLDNYKNEKIVYDYEFIE